MTGSGDRIGCLAVALDTADWDEYRGWCKTFGSHVGVLKVGLEAFVRWGGSAIDEARKHGDRIFLDLKLHDIPNTVAGAVTAASNLGVDYLTVHAAGGPKMLAAATEAVAAAGDRTRLLVVTLLTHLDGDDLARLDLPGSGAERVRRWAGMAAAVGCSGAVCSPQEVAELRASRGKDFFLATPGIRPAGAASHDQSRTATAAGALAAGSDLLVVGRPLTRAPDALEALRSLGREIAQAGR